MRVLVNALSTTNLSGRHVLMGHLTHLAQWTRDRHEFIVLHHSLNRDLRRELGPNVHWFECPPRTSSWLRRGLWERRSLPGLIRSLGADMAFFPSGVCVPALKVPQVVYTMNPWCLVPGVPVGISGKLKARLQRRAYRQAVESAVFMGFISEFMRDAYRRNAGRNERASVVAYPGIDRGAIEAAERLRATAERRPNGILCASVMAPHKGVETLLRAVAKLRNSLGVEAKLVLAGDWPDEAYQRIIADGVCRLRLGDAVEFRGYLPPPDLYRAYAQAKVFALTSRCESFGIPSVEAQTFGTPVITSNCCAMPEVCGAGAVYCHPDDADGAAAAFARLLTDEAAWRTLSDAARANAARFRWERCSRPLLCMFDAVASGQRKPADD